MESMNLETAETISPLASRQRAHRSAVSNGTRLFCVDGLDGRSQTARRFRDLVEGMGNDLGGSDRLSEGQRQLIRRAATLSIMSESVEADFIRNLAFDSEAYGVLCDRLGPLPATVRLGTGFPRRDAIVAELPTGKGGAMTKGVPKKRQRDEQLRKKRVQAASALARAAKNAS